MAQENDTSRQYYAALYSEIGLDLTPELFEPIYQHFRKTPWAVSPSAAIIRIGAIAMLERFHEAEPGKRVLSRDELAYQLIRDANSQMRGSHDLYIEELANIERNLSGDLAKLGYRAAADFGDDLADVVYPGMADKLSEFNLPPWRLMDNRPKDAP